RGAAHRPARAHRGGRLRHGGRRHGAPVGGACPGRSHVPRRPGGDRHRHDDHSGRGARARGRGGDRAGRRGGRGRGGRGGGGRRGRGPHRRGARRGRRRGRGRGVRGLLTALFRRRRGDESGGRVDWLIVGLGN